MSRIPDSLLTARDIAQALRGRRIGSAWMARCPAHEDGSPSLSISEKTGRILVHCFGGCSQDAVIDALRNLGLWPERRREGALPPPRDPDRWADLERAEYWRMAARILGDHLLEELPLGDPARLAITSLARVLGDPSDEILLARYRDWKASDATLTAALVHAGRLREARRQRHAARWLRRYLDETA